MNKLGKTSDKSGELPGVKVRGPRLPANPDRLEAGAEMLVDQLPDHIGELVHELAKEYVLPLWHIVCGVLLEVHSQGHLSAFQLDPAWRDGLRQREYKCKHCGETFKPIHIGQPYCSNKCGSEVAAGIAAKESEAQEMAVAQVELSDAQRRLDNVGKPKPDTPPSDALVADLSTPDTGVGNPPADWDAEFDASTV